MRVGPDKNKFVDLYNMAEGSFLEFNALLIGMGEDAMAERTFQRRVSQWIRNGEPHVHVPTKDEQDDDRPIAGGTIEAPDRLRKELDGTRFIFTSAQNNTYVHKAFWENLKAYAEFIGAQLIVGKFRYNKSGFQNSTKNNDEDLWFDPEVVPHVVSESCTLSAAVHRPVWCGELDILPTAALPLSGLDSYTLTADSIIPHAKVQLKSIPTMKDDPVKMMFTTGACTQRNYIERKAGQKAAFHHVFGATLVEIDEQGDHFVRQLIADSEGSFQDLTYWVEDGRVRVGESVLAINWGDIHAEKVNNEVALAGWDTSETSMVTRLTPEYLFIHDLTDFRARNHHNLKDPHFLQEMYQDKTDSVEEGLHMSVLVLQEMAREYTTLVVVDSNHDQALKRWLAEADIRHDPVNAEFFHTANARIHRAIREGDADFNVFEWSLTRHGELSDLDIVFLREDDSFIIGGKNGVECGMHGHRGPNGARGNPNSLRNLGRKCNIGHTHSAAIIDGIYVAGMSCEFDMGYNKGPSSWSHSHIVTYPNGKRTIITMKNGKWRA